MSDWERKAAVQEQLNQYSGAAARLDIKEYLSVFTEDAEFFGVAELLGQPGPLRGREKIGAFFGPMFENLEWLMQQNTTTDIRLSSDGKTATTSTSLIETAKPRGRAQVVLLARYDDELKLTSAGWKFTKRTLVPYRFTTVPE